MFKKIIKRTALAGILILVVSALSFWDSVFADLPQEIFLQARISKRDKTTISGSHSVIFRLYTDSSGGDALWTETQTLTADSSGIISCYLGSVTSFPSTLDFNSTYYLSLEVDGDGEMSPRLKLVPSFSALGADRLDAISSAQFLRSDTADTMEAPLSITSYVDHDYTGTSADALNINFNPTSGTYDALEITYGSGGATGAALKVTQSGTGDIFKLLDSTTGVFVVKDGGNVGIGTTSPTSFKLELAGSIGPASDSGYDFGSSSKKWANIYCDTIYGDIGSGHSAGGWADDGTVVRLATSTDNVGIGTTSPASKLEVAGQVKITGGTPGASKVLTSDADGLASWSTLGAASVEDDSLDFAKFEDEMDLDDSTSIALGNYDFTLNLSGTGDLRIQDDGSDVIFVQDTGNVGIGTSSPSSFKLEIGGNIGPDGNGTRNLGSATRYFANAYVNNLYVGSSGAVGYWSRTGTTLSPATAGDNVTTSGNISTTGTGTITSAGTLTASDGLTLTTGALNLTATSGALSLSGLSASSISTGSNNLVITSNNFNTTSTGINSTAIGATTASTGAFSTLSSTSTTTLASGAGAATTIGNATGTFELVSSALDISTAGALSGVTGITTSGGYTQSGTSANTFTGTATFSNATYPALFTGGNVGIGTTSPNANEIGSRLTVAGTDDTASHISIENAGAGQVGQVMRRTGTTPSRWYQYIPSGSTDLRFFNISDLLTFQASGNVGIGITAPVYKLHVSGDIRATGIIYGATGVTLPSFTEGSVVFAGSGGALSEDNAHFFWNDTDNRLGIGTTAPTAALEVAGQVKITGGTPGADKVLTSDANGLASWASLGAASVADDSLDFDKFVDAMSLDASTSVAFSDYNYTLNLTGNGDFKVQDEGTDVLFVSDAGNVGIGTNTPTLAKLTLQGKTTIAETPSENQSDGTIYLGKDTNATDGTPVNGSEYLMWDDDYLHGGKTGWFYFSGPVSMTSLNVRSHSSITFGTDTPQTISYDTDGGTGGDGAFTFTKEIITQSSSPAYLTFAKSTGTAPMYSLEFNPDASPQTLRLVKKPSVGNIIPLFEFNTDGDFSVFDSQGNEKTIISSGTTWKTNLQNMVRNGSFESTKPAGWGNYNTTFGTDLLLVEDSATAKFGNKYMKTIDDSGSYVKGIIYYIPTMDMDRLRGKQLTISLWARAASGSQNASIGYSYLSTDSAPVKAKNIALTSTWQNFIWTFPEVIPTAGTLNIKIYLLSCGVNNPDSNGVNQGTPAVNASATSNTYSYFDGITLVEGPLAMEYGPSPILDTGHQVLYGSLAIGANYDPYSSQGDDYYTAPRLIFGEPDSYFGTGYGTWGGGTGEIRFMRWSGEPIGRFMFNRSIYIMSGYETDYGAGIQIGDPYGGGPIVATSRKDLYVGGRIQVDGRKFDGTVVNSVFKDGNVGIGTTDPGAKLEVAGQVKITGGNPGASKVLTSNANGLATWETLGSGSVQPNSLDFDKFVNAMNLDDSTSVSFGNYDYTFNLTGSGDFKVQDEGTDVLFVSDAGNVGIGTNTPTLAKLTLQGKTTIAEASGANDSNGTIYLGKDTNATDGAPVNGSEYLMWNDSYSHGGKTGWFYFSGPLSVTSLNVRSPCSLSFGDGTSAAQYISYTSAGNMGIGTTAPVYKLDVSGDIHSTGTIYGNIAGTVTPAGFTNGSVVFAGSDGALTQDNANLFWDDTANRLGIGTATPLGLLQVGTSPTPGLLVTAAGNVGIGTTAPATKLQVSGGDILLDNNSAIRIETATGSQTIAIQRDTTNSLLFYMSGQGSHYYFNSPTGRGVDGACLVIGTIGSTPQAKLDIYPTTTNTADYIGIRSGLVYNGASAMSNWYGAYISAPTGSGTITNKYALVTEASAGNVGIGTTAPTQTLDVNGRIVTNNILVNNSGTTMSSGNGSHINTGSISIGSGPSGGAAGHDNVGLIAIGHNQTYTASNNIISIGNNAAANIANAISIGHYASPTASNQFVVGSATIPMTSIYFGSGVSTANPSAYTIYGSGSSGSSAGGDIRIVGGTSVSGTNGNVILAHNGSSTLGNVGIGMTAPNNKLEIWGANSNTPGTGLFGLGATNDQTYWVFRDDTAAHLHIDRKYGGSWYTALSINRSDGNVGIGTTAPGYKLEVNGTSKFSGNATFESDLLPSGSNRVIGASGNRWSNGYFDELTVTTMYAEGTEISGTINASFTINSDNATADGEQGSLVFHRGTTEPSATLTWNNTNDRFDFNFPLYISNSANNYFAGNVGIGTTVSAGKLEIASTTTGGSTLQDILRITAEDDGIPSNGLGAGILLRGRAVGGSYAVSKIGSIVTEGTYQAEDSALVFHTQKDGAIQEKLRIDNNGNVGIGTTNPVYKLDVSGDLRSTGTIYGSIFAGAGGSITLPSFTQGSVVFAGSGGTLAEDNANIFWNDTDNRLGIGTASPLGLLQVGTSPNPPLIVKADGNVGIGTTGPTRTLDVVGQIQASSAILSPIHYAQTLGTYNYSSADTSISTTGGYGIVFKVNNSPVAKIDSNGNVGIGTTSPGGLLNVVSGSKYAKIYPDATNPQFTISDGTTIGKLQTISTSNLVYVGAESNHNLDLIVNNASKVRINTDGNVGIGTATPLALLQVGTSPSPPLLVQAGGNIGIGTTSPGAKVHIVQTAAADAFRVDDATGDSTYFSIDQNGDMRSWSSLLVSGRVTDVGNRAIVGEKIGSVGTNPIGGNFLSQINTSSNFSDTIVGMRAETDIRPASSGGVYSGKAYTSYNLAYYADNTDGTGTATGSLNGMYFYFDDQSTYGNISNINGLRILPPKLQRAGSSVTTIRNLYVEDAPATTGAIGTMYGLYIGNMNRASTNYAVYSTGGQSYFAGNLGIGTTNPTYNLDVSGSIRATNTIYGNLAQGTVTPSGFTQGSVVFAGSGGTLTQDNANLFWNDTDNRLGVGTMNPSSLLHIKGSSASYLIVERTSGAQALLEGTGSYANVGSLSNHPLQLLVNNSPKLIIDTNGNVGIGTTGPESLLHLYSTGGAQLTITGGSSASQPLIQLEDQAAGGSAWNIENGREGNGILGFYNGGTTKIAINSSGNVGIGTTSPAGNLHINYTGTDGIYNVKVNSPKARIGVFGETSSGNYADFLFGEGTSDGQYGGILRCSNATPTYGGTVILYGRNNPVAISTSSTITSGWSMYFNQSGNVGIGTTAPTYKLDVSGSIRATETIYGNIAGAITPTGFTQGSVVFAGTDGALTQDNANIFWDDTNNRLGIGITSPQYPLHVAGTIYASGNLYTTTKVVANNGIALGSNYASLTPPSGGAIIEGNVGIGATAPAAKLEVIGGSVSGDYMVKIYSGANLVAWAKKK